MDITSASLENACVKFKKYFSNHFDWNDIDYTFIYIDVDNKQTYNISNNYEWQLICWDDDLDLLVNERLIPGVQLWSNYSEFFSKTLTKSSKRKTKIDFCNKYGHIFEISTINSKRALSVADTMAIYKYRPIIADYAHQLWKKNKEITLPLRQEIALPLYMQEDKQETTTDLLDTHQYMRFGNIRFTRKEIITIRLLLSHCRVKEISAVQGCSEASEHKRIQRIKEKLDCPYASPSGLFKVLKEHGITLACLETLVNFP
ncbi:helix-turn-helix transcriptional regulator [Providencia burhodogranariea]|uniref:Uncharacterized protein n=1 Tax=Providencia burhodogranariea DSM 19968 TaxID=1141662 RepID=K8WVR0_9GAMM|nr:hypothetical protein [Providencia burhodogranariea]EKT60285.1 hypothetical protein OOA_12750 [Providencia burhodogranariea DSM 19968]